MGHHMIIKTTAIVIYDSRGEEGTETNFVYC